MQPYDEMVQFAKDWKEWWGGLVNVIVKSCSNCGVAWFHSDDERIRSLQTWQDFGDDGIYCHKCTEAEGRMLWRLAKLASDAVVLELTPLEERCISICLAVVSVFSIGSSVTYRGHVSTMRSDVQSFVDTLPRDPRSVGIVVVKKKNPRRPGWSSETGVQSKCSQNAARAPQAKRISNCSFAVVLW